MLDQQQKNLQHGDTCPLLLYYTRVRVRVRLYCAVGTKRFTKFICICYSAVWTTARVAMIIQGEGGARAP